MKAPSKEVVELVELLTKNQKELTELVAPLCDYVEPKAYYIYAKEPEVSKPMLCVHLDTINDSLGHNLSAKDIELDPNIEMLSLKETTKATCLGGDDRAGLWIALRIIEWMEKTKNYPYNIGFFCDEEVGGIGSGHFGTDNLDINTSCFIGLDRRSPKGNQEIALYGDDNEELIAIFKSYGYEEAYGSFTDASNLSSRAIASINLSVGYDHEHTTREVVYVSCMKNTLEVLKEVSSTLTAEAYPSDRESYSGYDYIHNYDYEAMYIEELEIENEILKDTLESMGINVTELLEENKPSYYSPY